MDYLVLRCASSKVTILNKRDAHYLSFWRSTAAVSTNLHGILRPCPRLSTDNRGHSTGYRRPPTGFHGLPRNAAASRGTPWRPVALTMALTTAISTAISTVAPTAYYGNAHGHTHGHAYGNTHGLVHGNVRGHPWIRPRKHPRQDPRPRPQTPMAKLTATGPDGRGHDCYDEVCHGQNRGTCCGNSRGLPRTSVEVARIGGMPWQWTRTAADGRENCFG